MVTSPQRRRLRAAPPSTLRSIPQSIDPSIRCRCWCGHRPCSATAHSYLYGTPYGSKSRHT